MDFLLLDVRYEDERMEGKIQGAQAVSLNQLKSVDRLTLQNIDIFKQILGKMNFDQKEVNMRKEE